MIVNNEILFREGNERAIYSIDIPDEYHLSSVVKKKRISLTNTCEKDIDVQFIYTDGLFIIDCHSDAAKKIKSGIKKIKPGCGCIVMDFLFQGEIRYKYIDGMQAKTEDAHNLLYLPKECSQGKFSQKKTLDFFSIFLSRNFFYKLMDSNNKIHYDLMIHIQNKHTLFDEYLPMNHEMRCIISDIRNCTRKGDFFRYCLEIKIMSLLLIQWQRFHYQSIEKKSKIIIDQTINDEERKKINKVKAILEKQFAPPPTIKQLAFMVGINENKLKKLFKLLFNSTIHDYAIKIRMLKADELVKHQKLQTQEIAWELGYKSVSHFCSSFKRFFGYLPHEIKQKSTT